LDYRVNGLALDINSSLGTAVKFDNGTVLMNLYRKPTGEEKDSVVMLMSLEYKSGIFLIVCIFFVFKYLFVYPLYTNE
jgi:hypothetical protein